MGERNAAEMIAAALRDIDLSNGLLSQPQRMGARTPSRNLLNIDHPLSESSHVARMPISMMPGGGPASGYTQEDLATLALPKETTLFSPLGYDITDKDLAKFGLATDALDLVPGAAVLGGLATGAGLLGRALKGKNYAPASMDDMSAALLGQRLQRQGLLDDAMVTYHGSPYQFDEFDMGYLGTGEGVQAYGHGLYFAESLGEAKGYQPRDYDAEEIMKARYEEAVNAGDYNRADQWESAMLHETPDELRERSLDMDYDEDYRQAAAEVAEELAAIPSSSSLYTVDIPDEAIAKMLDWDAPLSEQPGEVTRALREFVEKNKAAKGGNIHLTDEVTQAIDQMLLYPNDVKGWELYQDLSDRAYEGYNAVGIDAKNAARGVSQEVASNTLKSLGIPGIKYWDEESFLAAFGLPREGEGTRNLVVFDDKLPTILERNGEPVY